MRPLLRLNHQLAAFCPHGRNLLKPPINSGVQHRAPARPGRREALPLRPELGSSDVLWALGTAAVSQSPPKEHGPVEIFPLVRLFDGRRRSVTGRAVAAVVADADARE
jgi:hypothetical protein